MKPIELYAEILKNENYPPIAGKILGLFYTSDQKYFTFEEIMEQINASKSATSKALKILLDTGEVNFMIKEKSKRRRLFYMDIEGCKQRIYSSVSAYGTYYALLKDTLNKRSGNNEELNSYMKSEIKFWEETLEFIKDRITSNFDIPFDKN
ncbi:hypothetical protein GWK08_05505 [Leptobacterium flavescens]|uniref:Uncharacterized protein n=1 Tax=Leptobacterium flavescens TaxID=472055 RepID=A0A6P0UR43_9FLAO|nr:hypothetical protein [Leptobacterium flavescens]NER12886.1 hypothetical protein [Leptobacterium flavescens]